MKTPEDLLRENVRDLISLVKKKNKNTQTEEQKLRAIIREFLQYELKEAKMHEYIKSGIRVADGVRGNPDYPDFHIRRELKMNPDATRQELVDAVMDNIPMPREKAEAAVDKHLSGEKDIKEAKTPDNDPAPHKSTGINLLEDLLKKIIPQIEDDYKILTTSEEQRESYRAHIIDAVVKTLTPVEINNDAGEDTPEEDLDEDINIQISADEAGPEDDDMFIDIDPDKPEAEEEEEEEDPRDAFGIEGKDTTGRNMAYTTFKKIESQIIDAYDMLSNPEDQELFFDYLIANLKLYFDKFENEIQPNVEEPTNKEYDDAKEEQPEAGGDEEAGDEGGDEETLDLEI